MKRSKFSDTQIVSILKQAEAGMPVKEVCRQNQISLLANEEESIYGRSTEGPVTARLPRSGKSATQGGRIGCQIMPRILKRMNHPTIQLRRQDPAPVFRSPGPNLEIEFPILNSFTSQHIFMSIGNRDGEGVKIAE